jgi:hypothetical protein
MANMSLNSSSTLPTFPPSLPPSLHHYTSLCNFNHKKLQQFLGVALGNPILYKLTYKDLGLFFKNSFHPKALFYPTQKHQFPPLPWGGSSTKYKNKNKKLIFIEKNKKKKKQ